MLIAVGVPMLGTYVLPDVGLYIVLALGLVFLAAFAFTRAYGFLVPGGILAGLGIGVALTPYVSQGMMSGALVVGALAVGFATVGILVMHLEDAHPWPFIPAAILGTVSLFMAIGQPDALRWLSIVVAVAMIVGGSWLMLRRRDQA